MELPIELKLASERLAEGISQGAMIDSAKELSRRYINESGTGKSLLNKQNEAAVYSLMRMPATFGAVQSILERVCQLSDFVPRSLLDAGAGTGAGSWAAIQYFNLDKIICLEREEAMRTIGKKLMSEAEDPTLIGAEWVKGDLVEEAEQALATEKVNYESDLVIASYVLNEMTAEDRMNVVKWLWRNTKKMLIIVEPGTPAGWNNIRLIRDYLLAEGAYMVAPCPRADNCSVKGDDWCHFSCRIQRGKLHKMLKAGDAPYEDEKYSYLAFSRETCNIEKNRYGRVMRHPITEKGRITMQLCTHEGIVTKTVTKKDSVAYKMAKKATCGDMLVL